MTYYVQKKVFNAGDVADGDDLMGEFYNAAAAITSIDQNNLSRNSINYSVALPPDPTDTSDRQRGPFVCYDDLANIATGLLFSTNAQWLPADLIADRFTDYENPDWELNFSSKTAATYTFMFHATVALLAYAAVDVVLKLNGVPIGSQQSFSGNTIGAATTEFPVFIEANHFIEPATYHLTVAIRPRGFQDLVTGVPTISHMTLGVIGFVR